MILLSAQYGKACWPMDTKTLMQVLPNMRDSAECEPTRNSVFAWRLIRHIYMLHVRSPISISYRQILSWNGEVLYAIRLRLIEQGYMRSLSVAGLEKMTQSLKD